MPSFMQIYLEICNSSPDWYTELQICESSFLLDISTWILKKAYQTPQSQSGTVIPTSTPPSLPYPSHPTSA